MEDPLFSPYQTDRTFIAAQSTNPPEIEVLALGETREWEVVEYVQDLPRRGPEESADYRGTRALRAGRHEVLRRVAEDVGQRGPGGVPRRAGAVLEPR